MEDADLRERLRRLGLSRGPQELKPERQRRKKPIEALLPGEVQHTRHGPFFLLRESFALEHRHGHHALSDLLAYTPAHVGLLAQDARMAEIDLRRVAFVDTETTGLAGGTGTYTFLVGVGRFDEDRFTVHQFFMRDFGEEPAQLYALGELLDGLEAVVSFNGKHFDMPLLETRFIMARQAPRLSGSPHLDLLTTARRFWRHRLASCALSSLEAEVLGVQRTQADVPGWLIPSLYLEYTRSGDAREMPRIFYHNAQDILSLVTLAAQQCDLMASAGCSDVAFPGEDLYGLGSFLHDLGRVGQAEVAYAQAARTCTIDTARELAMRDLAYLLKRQERRGEALPWWQELAGTVGAVYACEELAKHYEWHDQDLAQALSWTEQGMRLVRAWPAGPKRREAQADLEHRLERLRVKGRKAEEQ